MIERTHTHARDLGDPVGTGLVEFLLDQNARRRLEECVDASGFSAPVDRGALVYKDAQPFLFTFPSFSAGSAAAGDGAIVAPMPGKVSSIDVEQGEEVTKGQRLLTLEAMKMEHGMTAPFDGTVTELSAEAGAQVGEGTILARIEQQETK